MFLGHYAVALAGKKVAPKASLGTLVLAAQFLDLLWPLLLLLGLEHVRIEPGNTAFTPLDFYDYPISHSLVAAAAWSCLIGVLYATLRHYRRGAWVLAAAVFSHWLLDFVSHRPDLPLVPWVTQYAGLGLWNSVGVTIAVEGVLFIAGVILYSRETVPADRTGRYAFWSFIVFLAVSYTVNILSGPPPGTTAIAIGGMAQWLLVAWAYWIERHRKIRE